MIYQGKARYPVREAVLHSAAIRGGQFDGMTAEQVVREIDVWHKARGWRGFGYHGLFMPDGEFWPGRPFEEIGAHVQGHNRGKLGFLLIERKTITGIGAFYDWFSWPQRRELLRKLADIKGLQKVSGHNDYAAKLCPGFKVRTLDWL